ncbi:MAG: carboxypeptidase regulatory-like domain-containing protein [Bryobacteraceae bacterium]
MIAAAYAAVAYGQGAGATLSGRIMDSTGSVIPGAEVRIRNVSTNQSRAATALADGEFVFPGLDPGQYELTATQTGFQRHVETDLTLEVGQAARLDIRLSPGSISETIEVKAEVPLLNTENAVKGDVVISQEIAEIPLNGRDFSDLAFLVPGVYPRAAGASNGGQFTVNGTRNDNTNFVLDGFSNIGAKGSNIQSRPPIDAMQEFKMQVSGYSAEYGRLAGGVMSMALKSGGNQPHGSVFEYVRNDLLDARGFFEADKNKLRRNQFGASLSGPVFLPKVYDGRDRTFFLFAWESYRQVSGLSRVMRVPTELERAGDFSQTFDNKGKVIAIKDPLTSANFPNNRIPASRFNPVAVNLLPFYPLPNRPGQLNNYLSSAVEPDSWDSFTFKGDQKVFAQDQVSFRYVPRWSRSTDVLDGSDLGTFGSKGKGRTLLVGVAFTHLFSPVLINETRVGFTRNNAAERATYAGQDWYAKLGIAGGPTDPVAMGFPQINVRDMALLGDGASKPTFYSVNAYDVSDTLTWVRARHVLKFGGQVLRNQFFQPRYNNSRGRLNVQGRVTGLPMADFLLGYLNSATRQVGSPTSYLFSTSYGFFAQDDFKVSPTLTLNLGLRYEITKPPLEKFGHFANYIPELGKLVIADDITIPDLSRLVDAGGLTGLVGLARDFGLPKSLIYTNYRSLAPRLGFAWRPAGAGSMVVRGGYGIFYAGFLQNTVRNDLGNTYPLAVAQTFNAGNTVGIVTLSTPFPEGRLSLGSTTNTVGLQYHPNAQYLQTWNLTIERELGRGTAVEVGYAGSKGTHLARKYNYNQPYRIPGLQLADGSFPRPVPRFNNIQYYDFNSNSSYQAGVLTLRRRFARGVFYRLSYTFAKSIDTNSQFSGAGDGGYDHAQDSRNLALERGRSDFDVRQTLLTSFMWESPLRNRLLKGWQLAGTGRLYSGAPFTPMVANSQIDLGEADRPDRVAGGAIGNPGPNAWFDLNAFVPVPAGAYRFGNSGRNILDGPGTIDFNLSLMKKFAVGERSYFQFRWEAFNFINHANFILPVRNVDAANAGTITATGDGRIMQLAVRYVF